MTRLDRDGGGDLNRSLFFEGEREREREEERERKKERDAAL